MWISKKEIEKRIERSVIRQLVKLFSDLDDQWYEWYGLHWPDGERKPSVIVENTIERSVRSYMEDTYRENFSTFRSDLESMFNKEEIIDDIVERINRKQVGR